MKLYIIRHADPDYVADGLTATGYKEAALLAERLAVEGLTHLYTSPLGRARLTAHDTAERLKKSVTVLEWAREFEGWYFEPDSSGESTRLAAWNLPPERLRQLAGTTPASEIQDWIEQPGNKLRLDRLQADSDAFLAGHGYQRQGHLYGVESEQQDCVAVFCHNGIGLTWIAHLLHLPVLSVWTSFWLPPSSVTTLVFERRSTDWATPRCIGMGDTSHLHKGGLRPMSRGLFPDL